MQIASDANIRISQITHAVQLLSIQVKYVSEQMEKVQTLATEKMRVREAVTEVMEMKLQQQFAQQRAASGSAGGAGAST